MFLGGKLGENEEKPNTVFVESPKDFYDYIYSGKYNVTNFELMTDEIVQVSYKIKDDFLKTNPKTNVVLAA